MAKSWDKGNKGNIYGIKKWEIKVDNYGRKKG